MAISTNTSALEPPRLLAGVTLMYWGGMTGEALVALIIAVLLEGKNWVKWSWDFDSAAYVKAFQVSLGLLGLVLLMVWLDEINHNSLYQVMKWFPLCFLPVELAQRYGKSDRMNLNTFFYFSRQRMRQDIKEGRTVNPMKINTGYPYLFGVIVVASCSSRMDIYVHIAMLVLIAAVISAVSVKRGLSWKRLTWALPMMLLVAVWIQSEVSAIYKSYVASGRAFQDQGQAESSPHRSTLGQLGDMKQSQEIQWRMWGDDVPEYLRLNCYNKHHGVMWSYDYKSDDEEFETMEDAFENGPGIELGGEGAGLFVFDAAHEAIIENVEIPRKIFTLRGKGQSDTVESIVPAAQGTVAINKMAGDNVFPTVHPLGVLKLINRRAIINYELWTTDQNLLDSKPDKKIDLNIHKSCIDAVKSLSSEMQLSSIPFPQDKVEAIRDFFMMEFTYALHFEVPKTDHFSSDITRFMAKGNRRGHCEYFATTAALLLRNEGIPTRYCIGYVAREKDGDTWLMRGSHAHAWCSAWIDGKWQIVDLTPPDWLSQENEKNQAAWSQGFKDWFQSVKQDFMIWRTNEDNKSLMDTVMWILGGLLLAWFGYRLFKAKAKQGDEDECNGSTLDYELPKEMELLETQLSLVIGKRPLSQTFLRWVYEAETKLDHDLFSKLKRLVNLHEESRFGGKNKSLEISESSSNIQSLLKK